MAKSIPAQLPKSIPPTSEDSPSATSSPGSGAGATPSDSPAGMTTDLFGRAVAPVSPSARRAPRLGETIRATFGRRGFASSESADLTQSLVSKLKARLPTGGSTLFAMAWSEKATPSGRSVCRLAASGRRTSDNGSGSWPTPRTPTGGAESGERKQALGRTESGGGDLQAVALASWRSPAAQESGITVDRLVNRDGSPWTPGNRSYDRETGRLCEHGLTQEVLASWPTPTVESGDQDTLNPTPGQTGGTTLGGAAKLASWPTPKQRDHHTEGQGQYSQSLARAIGTLASWPTPNAQESGTTPENWEFRSQKKRASNPNLGDLHKQLSTVAQLASWAMPDTHQGGRTLHKATLDKGTAYADNGVKRTISLETQASWATPAAQNHTGVAAATYRERGGKGKGETLNAQVRYFIPGPTSSGSPAETAKPGQLNPAFSRWLMGYPAGWDSCGVTAMRSCLKLRRKSSPRT